jgi:hypothetical protein
MSSSIRTLFGAVAISVIVTIAGAVLVTSPATMVRHRRR